MDIVNTVRLTIPKEVFKFFRINMSCGRLNLNGKECIFTHSGNVGISVITLNEHIPFIDKLEGSNVTSMQGDDLENPGFKWTFVKTTHPVLGTFYFIVTGCNPTAIHDNGIFRVTLNLGSIPLDKTPRMTIARVTPHICFFCGSTGTKFEYCEPCKRKGCVFAYCNKECQRANWGTHKIICCRNNV